jgi:RimJ/RimL family protein N-acetyltransferase
LQTPRLILRLFVAEDADALVSVHGDPEVMRFSADGVKTREQITRFIQKTQAYHRRNGYSQWAIVWKSTGQCIGECGILVQHVGGIAEREISYRVSRSFWGRGIATEAATASRIHAFETLRLDRFISIIDPRNVASVRVAERVGMTGEKAEIFHGIPVVIYGAARTGRGVRGTQ